jgi:DNA processing protein
MAFPADERESRFFLNLHESLGPLRFARILERFGSAAEALRAPAAAWESLEDWGGRAAEFRRALDGYSDRWPGEKRRAEKLGLRLLCALDPEYPEGFRRLRDAPPALYVRGALAPVDSLGIAVVGARRPTAYGRAAAERLSRELAEAGVTVVSGLARGVDAVAHEAALGAGGRTVGILGSGFDRFYPREHQALADRMAGQGAVITEFPLASPPEAGHFPRRNRLIAALAAGVVVVEAAERSGALITAALAAEQGREVFAVPGSVFSLMSRGPHRLIKQGAAPVESASDVLESLGVFQDFFRRAAARPAVPKSPAGVSPEANTLWGALSLDPVHIDDLARRARLPVADAARELLTLELAGRVRALPGKLFIRAEKDAR